MFQSVDGKGARWVEEYGADGKRISRTKVRALHQSSSARVRQPQIHGQNAVYRQNMIETNKANGIVAIVDLE